MKKTIKETPKKISSSISKRTTRPHTTKRSGYEENVFNAEEQRDHEKTDVAKTNKRNTAGPGS